jgi:hypothetical protein
MKNIYTGAVIQYERRKGTHEFKKKKNISLGGL